MKAKILVKICIINNNIFNGNKNKLKNKIMIILPMIFNIPSKFL